MWMDGETKGIDCGSANTSALVVRPSPSTSLSLSLTRSLSFEIQETPPATALLQHLA